MARTPPPPLRRQLARVRRRLFFQRLLESLVAAWAAALALGVAWFLLQPHVLPDSLSWQRWAVLGCVLAAGTLAGLAHAVTRRPRAVDAALALDERYGLKERATTG